MNMGSGLGFSVEGLGFRSRDVADGNQLLGRLEQQKCPCLVCRPWYSSCWRSKTDSVVISFGCRGHVGNDLTGLRKLRCKNDSLAS